MNLVHKVQSTTSSVGCIALHSPSVPLGALSGTTTPHVVHLQTDASRFRIATTYLLILDGMEPSSLRRKARTRRWQIYRRGVVLGRSHPVRGVWTGTMWHRRRWRIGGCFGFWERGGLWVSFGNPDPMLMYSFLFFFSSFFLIVGLARFGSRLSEWKNAFCDVAPARHRRLSSYLLSDIQSPVLS